MKADCPFCGEAVTVSGGDALPLLEEHERPGTGDGVRCYGSGKPVERAAVSSPAKKTTAKKTAAKKSPGKSKK